jgi:hypothetical protein
MVRDLLDLLPFDADRHAEPSPVRAGVSRDGAVLSLQYVLRNPAQRWRLTAPRTAPARADRLWEHTCFEAFVAPEDSSVYWEIDLAASGDWNVYRFDGYRRGIRTDEHVLPPTVRATASPAGFLTLAATLDLTPLATIASSNLAVGLAAVLESQDGTLWYWALRHAAGRPDFHQRESFVVRLATKERA